MGVATTLAIGAGVAALAAGGSAVAQKSAADKAAAAQKKGLTKQQALLERELDPSLVNEIALKADRERALNRQKLQQEVDPELAKVRQLGKEQLLATAQDDRTRKASDQLFREQFQADPRIEALKDALILGAEQDIAAGATLPPEFQAELVRAGISTGAQAGLGVDQRSIGGNVARLLGGAGIQLQQQRTGQALQKLQGAQAITDARTNILANIFPKIELQRAAAGAAAFGVGDSTLPEAGITGTQAANLQLAKAQGQAKITGQQAQLQAEQAKTQGQFISSLIGAGAGAVNAGVGIGGAAFSGAFDTPTSSLTAGQRMLLGKI